MRSIDGVSVVIPALDEEASIEATIRTCADTLRSWAKAPFEIVVIDDGSSDGTAKVALEAGAILISHPANGGYGKSLKDGINAAKYEVIAMTDADSTYPIADLPKLLDAYLGGFDMAVGARIMGGGGRVTAKRGSNLCFGYC